MGSTQTDADTRRRIMQSVRSRDTHPEMAVRKMLTRLGLRYRLHRADLPGTPDIVLPKYGTAIFVNGCFWHQHPGCHRAALPRQNRSFWEDKLRANARRDESNRASLEQAGWRVLTVWECELRTDPASVEMQLSTHLGVTQSVPPRRLNSMFV